MVGLDQRAIERLDFAGQGGVLRIELFQLGAGVLVAVGVNRKAEFLAGDGDLFDPGVGNGALGLQIGDRLLSDGDRAL